MSYQYLQSKQCYEDRYDLQTIKECFKQLQMVEEIGQKVRLEPTLKRYPDSEHERNMGLFRGRLMFLIQAECYKHRDSTISEWMEADRIKQDKQDNAVPPNVNCPECGTLMVADDFRTLEDWPEDQPMRVLFILNCPKCKKHLGAYDNGELHSSKSDICPKCDEKLEVANGRNGKVITTLFSCKHCGYSKEDVLDLNKSDDEHKKWEEEHERKEQEDKQLLEKYRAEFCLSEKEGKEYVETLEAMEVAHEVKEEILAEMDTPAHEKLLSVHKITITDLETVVNKALVDSGFSRLSIGNPEIDRYVIVPFTLQDVKPKRRDLESISDLYDLLKPKLEETNWRVPKDLISYRLGFLNGKLKGYESEEDLLKLFGKEEPKKPKSKLDPAFRAKYEHHHFVQLVRLEAEYEVTKRIRTRRLKNEPEGFFLNDGGRGYTCGICRNNHDGEDIWWRPDGLRCRDCWRNIQEGVIPMLDLDKERWEKEFLTKFDLTYDYKIHPSSIQKLRKEGVLVGRDLKDSAGHAYETVYLVSENQEFIKKYKKQD